MWLYTNRVITSPIRLILRSTLYMPPEPQLPILAFTDALTVVMK